MQQAATKTLRFGPGDRYPNADSSTTQERLLAEIYDLMAVIELLEQLDIIPQEQYDIKRKAIAAKKAKVAKYMKYAEERGTL